MISENKELPESWLSAKMYDTGLILSGGTPDTSKPEYWRGDILWCTPTDITSLKGSKYIHTTVRQITSEGLKNSSANILPAKSLVICTRATVGDCAINVLPMTTNQGFKAIIPNSNWSVEFLYYLTLSLKKQLIRQSSGSTFLELSKKAFENIDIQFPPLSEQRKIAEILSIVDDKIDVINNQMIETEKLKQSLMQQFLTKGIGHTKFKTSDLGNIPIGWEVKELDEVSDITKLTGFEYTQHWKETSNGEIMTLRGYNIGKNKIIHKDIIRIDNELSLKLNRSRLNKGDVVFPCVGTIGNAAVIEENDTYHINQNIAKITPYSCLDSNFLVHYLLSDLCKKEVFRFNATTTQPNVLIGSLRKFRILLPTENEQKKIAQILNVIYEKVELLELKKEYCIKLKNGLMQQLLSGKMRVSTYQKQSAVA